MGHHTIADNYESNFIRLSLADSHICEIQRNTPNIWTYSSRPVDCHLVDCCPVDRTPYKVYSL